MKKPRGNREVSRPPRGFLLLNVFASIPSCTLPSLSGKAFFQVSAYALTVSSSVTGFGLTFATTLLICFVENKNAATTTSIARSTSTKEL